MGAAAQVSRQQQQQHHHHHHHHHHHPGSPVSVMVFHRLEFWATLCYALVEALSLVYTPKSLFSIYSRLVGFIFQKNMKFH